MIRVRLTIGGTDPFRFKSVLLRSVTGFGRADPEAGHVRLGVGGSGTRPMMDKMALPLQPVPTKRAKPSVFVGTNWTFGQWQRSAGFSRDPDWPQQPDALPRARQRVTADRGRPRRHAPLIAAPSPSPFDQGDPFPEEDVCPNDDGQT